MLGGLQWGAALGNTEMVSSAKDRIVGGIIGLVLALSSYAILAALNVNLVLLPDIEVPGLSFVSGGSCEELGSTVVYFDDDIEANYPELIPYYRSNISADESCMSQRLYGAFVKALQELEDNLEYTGMRLVVSSTFRSLETQQVLYDCYEGREPDGSCGAPCTVCNYATEPPSADAAPTGHYAADAMDITWEQVDSNGTYETLWTQLTSTWHHNCLFQKLGSEYGCSDDLTASVEALNALMDDAGVNHICNEWWHHEPAATAKSGTYCAGVVYGEEEQFDGNY